MEAGSADRAREEYKVRRKDIPEQFKDAFFELQGSVQYFVFIGQYLSLSNDMSVNMFTPMVTTDYQSDGWIRVLGMITKALRMMTVQEDENRGPSAIAEKLTEAFQGLFQAFVVIYIPKEDEAEPVFMLTGGSEVLVEGLLQGLSITTAHNALLHITGASK